MNTTTETTTIDTVTDSQIRDLQRAAGQAGDLDQVSICRMACGDEETATQTQIQAARKACVAVIADAEQAQAEHDREIAAGRESTGEVQS